MGSEFSRDSSQESKEPLRLNRRRDFENDPVSRRSAEETLRGDRVDLSASVIHIELIKVPSNPSRH
jgi:hypothetical protein